MIDPLEEAGKKYIPFPKDAEYLEIFPHGYIIKDKDKYYKVTISEHIPNIKGGEGNQGNNRPKGTRIKAEEARKLFR